MDNAAQPAGRVPERVTVTRQSLIRLCDFIPEYAAAARIKPNAAASDLARAFRVLARHRSEQARQQIWAQGGPLLPPRPWQVDSLACLDAGAAWLASPGYPHHDNGLAVSVDAVAGYFHDWATKLRNRPEGVTLTYRDSTHTAPASDELLMFAPEPLARLFEAAGEPVPVCLLTDPAPAKPRARAGTSDQQGAEGTREMQVVQEAWRHFWSDWDKANPPQQKAVAVFIGERLGLPFDCRRVTTLASACRPDDAPTERGGRL